MKIERTSRCEWIASQDGLVVTGESEQTAELYLLRKLVRRLKKELKNTSITELPFNYDGAINGEI